MPTQKPREIAVDLLTRWDRGEGFIDELWGAHPAADALKPSDRALVQELAYGVVRWLRTLDWVMARRVPRPVRSHTVRYILRLGLYQLLWLDRIPAYAAIDESVSLARTFGARHQAGFVNAVLRATDRDQESLRQALEELRGTDLGLGYSHPDWLCARWEQRWDRPTAIRLLAWNNSPPPVFARLNQLRANPDQLTAAWTDEGVVFQRREWSWLKNDFVYELTSFPSLAGLPSFQQGWFYVQDPSTLLSVQQLEVSPSQTVLDLCAAPGGKTAHIAQYLQNRGEISAQDRDLARFQRVEENCRRLGVQCVTTSRTTDIVFPELTRQFDRILVDAPCSNTGVLRRRVDLRWRLEEKEIVRLARLQRDLLERAAVQVKPGGVLVYSTCSLEKEENEDQAAAFVRAHPEFTLISEEVLRPFADGVDGAYVATFRRAG